MSAVETRHKNAVAHGDIKVENILLDSKYQILLTDFGSTKDVINEKKIERFKNEAAKSTLHLNFYGCSIRMNFMIWS